LEIVVTVTYFLYKGERWEKKNTQRGRAKREETKEI